MDKVRCLLIQSGLPKTFRAEATCTAAYLINKSPSTSIEKKTPMEMWSGHLSDYGMLRIFGCVVYPHDKQGKLEPRAIKCVLLGYPDGVKGYKLYRLDGESPKIVTSRNVVFNESVMYKDTLKDSGASDTSVKELQVEVELQRLNNHTPEEDQIDQEDGDDEDAGDQETDQPSDLTDYQLAFVAAEEEDTHEPLTYQEAVACEDNSKWKAAMKEEMDSLRKNKTWELVDHPAGQKLVSYKWLFKIKEGIEAVQKPRYKARLVARGFTQRTDYELEQLDIKTTFLHVNLEEVIYMKQPPGYEQGNKVCLLKKSHYGLKQSPRQSYMRFDEYMMSNGFKRSSYDSCVYYRSYAPGEYIYLLLYVDDMLIACKSKAEIESTKSLLKKEFDMKELGEANKILGMEFVRDRSRKILRVSQSGYVSKILNNFRIDNGKSVKMPLGGHFKLSLKDCPVRDCDVERMSKVPYANAVESLMYLMVCTRPDIAYARGLKTKTVKVLKVGTEHNVADALTKVVPGFKLQHCLELPNVGDDLYLAFALGVGIPWGHRSLIPGIAMLPSYEQFMDTLLYGWEALTLEDVMATLNSKEIKERSKAKGDDGEGLYVRGRTDRRDSHQNCPKNNHKKSTGYAKKEEQPSPSGSTYDDFEVMMVMSAQAQALLDWIMDSGCSYHMTPRGIEQDEEQLNRWGTSLCYTMLGLTTKRLGQYQHRCGTTCAEKQGPVLARKSPRFKHEAFRKFKVEAAYECESPTISLLAVNVIFNESVMYKDTLKDSGADQEDGDDEDAGDQETDQPSDLTDYQLVRDRERRTKTKPLRFRDESNMAA
ncbi:retrotransposon protein, putative, ty1-copia subclass [Tanacetum coccineum]